MGGWISGGIVAVLVVVMFVLYGQFNTACHEHGGVHVTYPYKTLPECWDAEGRRVFW